MGVGDIKTGPFQALRYAHLRASLKVVLLNRWLGHSGGGGGAIFSLLATKLVGLLQGQRK